ncbi:hypothetical protein GGI08_007110, partial [Coemansia sp. S2]
HTANYGSDYKIGVFSYEDNLKPIQEEKDEAGNTVHCKYIAIYRSGTPSEVVDSVAKEFKENYCNGNIDEVHRGANYMYDSNQKSMIEM